MARKVRSPEGAQYYGQPIGTLITADMIAKARAMNKGKPAPRGATGQVRTAQKTPTPRTPPGYVRPQPEAEKAAAAAAATKAAAKKPAKAPKVNPKGTLSGPQKFAVGKREFSVPTGTKVYAPKDSGDTAYVIPPDGSLHVYVSQGEVSITPEMQAALKSRIMEEGEGHLAPIKLPDAKPESKPEPKAEKTPATTPEKKPDPKAKPSTDAAPKADPTDTPEPDAEKTPASEKKPTPSQERKQKLLADADEYDTLADNALAKLDQQDHELATELRQYAAELRAQAEKINTFERKPDSLGESVAAPDAEEVEALRDSPFTSQFIDDEGNFTPERIALHNQIIESFLEGLKPVENPVQYMNGGGPASGKGTMTKGKNADLTMYPPSRHTDDITGEFKPMDGDPEALLIDPDAIKLQFPEVKNAVKQTWDGSTDPLDNGWAGHIHEESSQVAKKLHRAALDRGYNVIYDGTGNGSANSVMTKVNAAREAGYGVEANYLYLDPVEGLDRAVKRAEGSKRIVPPKMITKTYAALPEIFDQIKVGVFDKVNLFDNNVPRGEPARLIGRGGGDEFEILDPDAYREYLGSADKARSYVHEAPIQKDLNTTRSAKESQQNGGGGTDPKVP